MLYQFHHTHSPIQPPEPTPGNTNPNAKSFSRARIVTTFAGATGLSTFIPWSPQKFGQLDCFCLNAHGDAFYICHEKKEIIKLLLSDGSVTRVAEARCGRGIVCYHADNTIFFIDHNSIMRTSESGLVTVVVTIPGGDEYRYQFQGLTINQQTGDLYATYHGNNSVLKISQKGDVVLLAGSGGDGFLDGKGIKAKFWNPSGICFDSIQQCLFVCDYGPICTVRKVTLEGIVTTAFHVEGANNIAISSNSSLFVAGANNIFKAIKRRDTCKVEKIAGTGKAKRKDGKPMESSFHLPSCVVVHECSHSLFVSDLGSHTIRQISFCDE